MRLRLEKVVVLRKHVSLDSKIRLLGCVYESDVCKYTYLC